MSMKNSNDTIGNRTRDLPSCSAVSINCATACPRETGRRVVSFRYCSLYYTGECVLLLGTYKIPGFQGFEIWGWRDDGGKGWERVRTRQCSLQGSGITGLSSSVVLYFRLWNPCPGLSRGCTQNGGSYSVQTAIPTGVRFQHMPWRRPVFFRVQGTFL